MLTSSPIISHSGGASPFDIRETRWLQSPRDWHRLVPSFPPATSSVSTQSSSSRLRDEDKQQTQGPSGTPRTNVHTRSLSDTGDAAANQVLCQAQSQGTQQGSSNDEIKDASPCPVGGTALISNTSNQFESDKKLPIFLPSRYEFCPVEDMVELISHMLGELIATNDLDAIASGGLTRFHSRYIRIIYIASEDLVLILMTERLPAYQYETIFTDWLFMLLWPLHYYWPWSIMLTDYVPYIRDSPLTP